MEKSNEKENLRVYARRQPMSEERWRKPDEEENVRVYMRRQLQHEQQQALKTGEVQFKGEQHHQQQIRVVDEVLIWKCAMCHL
jgi:hypothetical protein